MVASIVSLRTGLSGRYVSLKNSLNFHLDRIEYALTDCQRTIRLVFAVATAAPQVGIRVCRVAGRG
jgi:hypothetical protein